MTEYFSAEHLILLDKRRRELRISFLDLRDLYISREFASDRAREFAVHGYCRRLGILIRAIDLVYDALPPGQSSIPERDEVVDATIAIQSFVLNTFGCLDNLAWIWVHEKDVRQEDGTELDPKSIGLGARNKDVRRSFSKEFRDYLHSLRKWFDHLKDFRDSLAHRIPLYIPPYIVAPANAVAYNELENAMGEALKNADIGRYEQLRSEQEKLRRFRPWMTHSWNEKSRTVVFHSQLLADYATVDELGRNMLKELDR